MIPKSGYRFSEKIMLNGLSADATRPLLPAAHFECGLEHAELISDRIIRLLQIFWRWRRRINVHVEPAYAVVDLLAVHDEFAQPFWQRLQGFFVCRIRHRELDLGLFLVRLRKRHLAFLDGAMQQQP